MPTAKIEGDGNASSAQLIRKSAVNHGPSHDHASDGQSSYGLRCGAATSAILGQAPLQDAYHCFEHGLEGALRLYPASRDVGRQRDHRAGILDILEMLAR
jgi:hypothetical protein